MSYNIIECDTIACIVYSLYIEISQKNGTYFVV